MCESFLPWPGGREYAVPTLLKLLPKEEDIKTYYEPVLGMGCLYFYTKLGLNPSIQVRLTSADSTLDVYSQVKRIPELLTSELNLLYEQCSGSPKECFTRLKTEWQKEDAENFDTSTIPYCAARQIYLLQNSLYNLPLSFNTYRRKGRFISTFGKPFNYNPGSIAACSSLLQQVPMNTWAEMGYVVREAKEGDFVFFNSPPTFARKKKVKVAGYSLTYDDQVKMLSICDKLTERGVRVLMLNFAYMPILDLYKRYDMYLIPEPEGLEGPRWARAVVISNENLL